MLVSMYAVGCGCVGTSRVALAGCLGQQNGGLSRQASWRVGGGKRLGTTLTVAGYREVSVQTDRNTDEYTGIVGGSWGAGGQAPEGYGGGMAYMWRVGI